jgi:hypothetical protein
MSLSIYGAVKSVDEKERTIDFVLSDFTEDRHGEKVDQSWDFADFDKNPVALECHNMNKRAIGQVVKHDVIDGALEVRVKFFEAELNPESEALWKLYKSGAQRAISAGFTSAFYDWETRTHVRPSLVEVSLCPVGANVNALSKSAWSKTSMEWVQKTLGVGPEHAEKAVKALISERDSLLTTVKTLEEAAKKHEDSEKEAIIAGGALPKEVASFLRDIPLASVKSYQAAHKHYWNKQPTAMADSPSELDTWNGKGIDDLAKEQLVKLTALKRERPEMYKKIVAMKGLDKIGVA